MPGATKRLRPDENGTRAYVRRELWYTLIFFIGLLLAVTIASTVFREEMTTFATAIYSRLGLTGMAMIVFVTDSLVSPIPPDVIIYLLVQSRPDSEWLLIALLLGALSTIGGHIGWFLGWHLGGTRFIRRIFGRSRSRGVALMERYGVWAIVLAALTPIPWSVTSWSAGVFKLRWRLYLLGSLARLPRIVFYYAVIQVAVHHSGEFRQLIGI